MPTGSGAGEPCAICAHEQMDTRPARSSNERAAVLHPVPVIAVEHAIDGADAGTMDVPADDAVQAALHGRVRRGVFVRLHVAHRVLEPQLEVVSERPVRHAEHAPHEVDAAVQAHRELVRATADARQPAAALHGRVELVPVHDQQLAAIRGGMHVLAADLEIAEHRAAELAHVIVVVAGHVDHACAFARLAEDGAHHLVVLLRPVEVLAQAPEIDDVADQEQIVDFDAAEELQ